MSSHGEGWGAHGGGVELSRETKFAVTPEVLWPWLVEPARLREWMEGFIDNRYPSGFDQAAPTGQRFTQVISEGGREATYEVVILRWEPARAYEQMSVGPHFDCTLTYTLTPAADGTVLHQRVHFDLRTLVAKAMAFVGKAQAERILARAHRRLDEVLATRKS